MSGEQKVTEPVNVIEVRKARNGYVITAWFTNPWRDQTACQGYQTYVCQSEDFKDVGKLVEHVLKVNRVSEEVPIPMARRAL